MTTERVVRQYTADRYNVSKEKKENLDSVPSWRRADSEKAKKKKGQTARQSVNRLRTSKDLWGTAELLILFDAIKDAAVRERLRLPRRGAGNEKKSDRGRRKW